MSPRSSPSIINSTTSQQHSEEEAYSYEARFPSQVSALESTFEKIQNDYILSAGSEKSKEDYSKKMKVFSFISSLWKHFS